MRAIILGIVFVVGCHLDSSQSFKISGMTLKDYSEWSQWQERAEMRQDDYGTYGDNGTDEEWWIHPTDCFEMDIAYPDTNIQPGMGMGSDMATMDMVMDMNAARALQPSSPKECQVLCQQEPTCQYFTFRPDLLTRPGCWLKTHAVDPIIEQTGVISGPKFCPVNCEWNPWKLGQCSLTCGNGTQTDTRTRNITEMYGGVCDGPESRIEQCNTFECPIDCEWDVEENWIKGNCSQACGNGTKTIEITKKVEAEHGGAECDGPFTYEDVCNDFSCCSGWRQTDQCRWDGNLESHNYKGCTAAIDAGWSGRCECFDGSMTMKKGCKTAAYQNCDAACKAAFGVN